MLIQVSEKLVKISHRTRREFAECGMTRRFLLKAPRRRAS